VKSVQSAGSGGAVACGGGRWQLGQILGWLRFGCFLWTGLAFVPLVSPFGDCVSGGGCSWVGSRIPLECDMPVCLFVASRLTGEKAAYLHHS